MSSKQEMMIPVRELAPQDALELGVKVGLLSQENKTRLFQKEYSDQPTADIILPALRRIEDFEVNEEVWIYDPMHRFRVSFCVISDIIFDADRLVVKNLEESNSGLVKKDYSRYIRPIYYGLWKLEDLNTISRFNATSGGKGYMNPSFIMKNADNFASSFLRLPEADDELVRKTNQRLDLL